MIINKINSHNYCFSREKNVPTRVVKVQKNVFAKIFITE